MLDLCTEMQILSKNAKTQGFAELSQAASGLGLRLLDGSVEARFVRWQRSGTSVGASSSHPVEWIRSAGSESATLRPLEMSVPQAVIPCLALRHDHCGNITAQRLHKFALGDVKPVPVGSLAFVRIPGEDFLRAARKPHPFGEAKGHGALANQQPVLFAGEVDIDERGRLIRWNNMSGTYHFPEQHAFQAQLPLGSFWRVTDVAPTQDSSDWLRVSDGVWLQKSNAGNTIAPVSTEGFWKDCEASLQQIKTMLENTGFTHEENNVHDTAPLFSSQLLMQLVCLCLAVLICTIDL